MAGMSDDGLPQARETAQRLLDAQVAFLAAELTDERFARLAAEEIDHALRAADSLTLAEVVEREQVQAVAAKYAVMVRIPGSIPEIIGEVAARLYGHAAHDRYSIGELLPPEHAAALVIKLLDDEPLGRRLLERLMTGPIAASWLTWLLERLAADARERSARVPGVAPLLAGGRRALGRVSPGGTRQVDARLHELAEDVARRLLREVERVQDSASAGGPLAEAVLELYDELADRPVSAFRGVLSQDDLEDLLVIVYELWLDVRETGHVRAMIDEGVALVFDKYGDVSLRELLEDLGIGRDDLLEEALRFGPPALAVLRERGLVDAFFRRRLEPFFLAPDTLALL